MTYRERRERRAERLRGWADKRQVDANATLDTIRRTYSGDHAFNFQPGHIPERARVIARQDRAFASLDKAASMDSRASNIEAQLDRSIYSDDPDAIERLRERIAELEAARERIKSYNASCRKGAPDESLLTEAERAGLASVRKYSAYSLGKHGEMPAYELSNLAGNISRQRERLARLEAGSRARARVAEAAAQGAAWTVTPTSWPGYVEVAFPSKPDREILDELRAAGFRWHKVRAAWQGERAKLPERYQEEHK